MTHAQEMEAMFNRYSPQKQEKELLALFRKIQDKGRLYQMAVIIHDIEKEDMENRKVIRVNFSRQDN